MSPHFGLIHGQHHVWCHVRSPARELGVAHSRARRKVSPPYRAENLLPLPLYPSPLSALRLLQRCCKTCWGRPADHSGGRYNLQTRAGKEVLGHKDNTSSNLMIPEEPPTSPTLSVWKPISSPPPPLHLEAGPSRTGRMWIFTIGIFRKIISSGSTTNWLSSRPRTIDWSFRPNTIDWSTSPKEQTGPWTTADPKIFFGSWRRRRTGRKWRGCRRRRPSLRHRWRSWLRSWVKRGRRSEGTTRSKHPQYDQGAGGTTGRGCQQGAPLRSDDGIWRSVFRQANPPHPREIFTDDSGKNLEGSSAEWNTQAGVLSVSTRKANRNPRRGGRQNGASAESPCGSGTL